jgi:hypothetical protein
MARASRPAVFRVVQPYGKNKARESTIISEHATAAEAFAEIDRLSSEMVRTGAPSDAIEFTLLSDMERLTHSQSQKRTPRQEGLLTPTQSPSSRPPVAAAFAAPCRRPPSAEPRRNPTRALREPAGDERHDALRAALVEPQLAPEVVALCAVREAEREAHVEHPRIAAVRRQTDAHLGVAEIT